MIRLPYAVDRERLRKWLSSGEGMVFRAWLSERQSRVEKDLASQALDYSIPANATHAHRRQGEHKLLSFELDTEKFLDELEQVADKAREI
jgi:hypothetical protein